MWEITYNVSHSVPELIPQAGLFPSSIYLSKILNNSLFSTDE